MDDSGQPWSPWQLNPELVCFYISLLQHEQLQKTATQPGFTRIPGLLPTLLLVHRVPFQQGVISTWQSPHDRTGSSNPPRKLNDFRTQAHHCMSGNTKQPYTVCQTWTGAVYTGQSFKQNIHVLPKREIWQKFTHVLWISFVGFQKWEYPQSSSIYCGMFDHKPSIVEYPHLINHFTINV